MEGVRPISTAKRRPFRRAALLASAPVFLSACVLAVDFDEFTRGAPTDAGSADAPLEATVDAPDTDGPDVVDAGPHVVEFCSGATFCDEFDPRPTVQGAWDSLDGGPEGGEVALSIEPSGGNRTDGGYLRAVVPAGHVASGFLGKALGPAKRMTLRMAFRSSDMQVGREVDVGLASWSLAVGGWAVVYVRVSPDDAGTGSVVNFVGEVLSADGGRVETVPFLDPALALPVNTWANVRIEMQQSAFVPTLTIYADDAQVAGPIPLPDVQLVDRAPVVNAGCTNAAKGTTLTNYTFDIDDVRVDLE